MQYVANKELIPVKVICKLCGISRTRWETLVRWYRNANYEKPPGAYLPPLQHINCRHLGLPANEVHYVKEFDQLVRSKEEYRHLYRYFDIFYNRSEKIQKAFCKKYNLDIDIDEEKLIAYGYMQRKEKLK